MHLLGLTVILAAFAIPLVAEAQPPTKVARVGMLAGASRSAVQWVAFEHRLRELGYVEGQNLVLEFLSAEGHVERFPDLAAALVQRNLDVIVVPSAQPALRAARQATSTIPIVMIAIDFDPIAQGYIAGLARPGGNITGLVLQQLEVTGKRLEVLKDVVPQLTRVAVLWDAFSADELPAAEAAARRVSVKIQPIELRSRPYDYASAFSSATAGRAEAVLPLTSPVFFLDRARLVALLETHRLPAIHHQREFVIAGGLMAYGASINEAFRRAADYVDRILRGAKPADLPVEQPTKFELVINLETAKALGLTIPQSIRVRADEIIQ
jgi:putative tryptophan/tyrosine transport system substrate-binding protein